MEKVSSRKSIKSFRDLEIYQNLCLPKEEKFDLGAQMKRASKGAPALIAEGFAKRSHRYLRYQL